MNTIIGAPGVALVHPETLRATPGMVKLVKPGQKVMVVDIEFPTVMVLLITGEVDPTAAAPLALVNWELNTGITQGQFGNFSIQAEKFSRIAIARSIQLVVTNPSSNLDAIVKCVVVPINATVSAADILGTDPVAPEGPPNSSAPLFIATNTASVSFTGSLGGIFAPGKYRGLTVFNSSPASRNLYLFLNSGPAAIGAHQYTVMMVPNSYYEVPFGYSGDVTGIWDGVDLAGGAVCTFFGFQA